jgi:hypothetical protein
MAQDVLASFPALLPSPYCSADATIPIHPEHLQQSPISIEQDAF